MVAVGLQPTEQGTGGVCVAQRRLTSSRKFPLEANHRLQAAEGERNFVR
jgi:hypothetical protein